MVRLVPFRFYLRNNDAMQRPIELPTYHGVLRPNSWNGTSLEDEMQVESRRSFQIGSLEKSDELLVPMAGRVNPQSVGLQMRRIWVF